MKRSMLGIAVIGLVAAAGSANAADYLSENFSLTGGVGSYSKTSADPIDMASGIAYSIAIDTATMSGLAYQGTPSTVSLTSASFGGLSALSLNGNGETNAAAPVTLWMQNYSFTEPGNIIPVYDFTVTLDLLADRHIRTTLTVNSLGVYQGALAPITSVTPTSITIAGSMGAAVVPAPTAAAPLAGAGLLALRRRRR